MHRVLYSSWRGQYILWNFKEGGIPISVDGLRESEKESISGNQHSMNKTRRVWGVFGEKWAYSFAVICDDILGNIYLNEKLGVHYGYPWILGLTIGMKESVVYWANQNLEQEDLGGIMTF